MPPRHWLLAHASASPRLTTRWLLAATRRLGRLGRLLACGLSLLDIAHLGTLACWPGSAALAVLAPSDPVSCLMGTLLFCAVGPSVAPADPGAGLLALTGFRINLMNVCLLDSSCRAAVKDSAVSCPAFRSPCQWLFCPACHSALDVSRSWSRFRKRRHKLAHAFFGNTVSESQCIVSMPAQIDANDVPLRARCFVFITRPDGQYNLRVVDETLTIEGLGFHVESLWTEQVIGLYLEKRSRTPRQYVLGKGGPIVSGIREGNRLGIAVPNPPSAETAAVASIGGLA